jgi:ribosomal protein S18 acetylase RimI-like enzyme
MPIRQIDHGSFEYGQMVDLRNEILRIPLGLLLTNEELEQEKNDILIGAFDEQEILGCCLLTKVDKKTVRLRQMAVKNTSQGMGIGASLMNYAENVARDKGFSVMIMHARETAIGFYEKAGYHVEGEKFTEVNVPHYLMVKMLNGN